MQRTVRLHCVSLTDPVPCLGSLSNVEGVITPKAIDGSTALRSAHRSCASSRIPELVEGSNHKREHRVVRLGTGPVDYKGSLGWQLRLPFFYTEEI